MSNNPNSQSRVIEFLVIFCFALSGMAALIYQTAWMRLFSIAFGTSELAIATVLAAYMGGLALGSVIASRYADLIRNPVKVYAVLEGGVAITALLVPWLLSLASALYALLLGSQLGPPASGSLLQTIYYLVATFAIVGFPTVLMGATLPILAHHLVKTNAQIGPKIGLIYGVNTAGAVLGVLIASFLLLPNMGLQSVVWVGVVTNGVIFLLAIKLASFDGSGQPSDLPEQVTNSEAESTVESQARGWLQRPEWILPVMLGSGAASFIYEVLWTRLLGHMLGSSIYAFATMLSTFLAGIAIGGGLGGWLSRWFKKPANLMVLLQVGVALASLATYYILELHLAESASTTSKVLLSMLVLFPSALFIGATYPVAVRIFTLNPAHIGESSGKVYAWNTLGAIVGAIFAGFLLLPEFGFTGAIRFTVLLNLGLGLAVACLVLPVRSLQATSMMVLTLVALVAVKPPRPDTVIMQTAFPVYTPGRMDELYYSVGKSSTVMLNETLNYYDLRTNGLPEAQVFFKGGINAKNSQRWLGLLPVLARPDSESMLVIGLGGGTAVEGVPPTVKEIDVIELEEKVVVANEIMSGKRNYDPMTQERVTIVVNDARNALNLTDKRYDAIVSQPSHPWTAGASHLYTREFVQLLKSHLNEDGVLLMWMNSEFVTGPLLISLMATIQSEFQHVRVYETAQNVLNFVASDGDLRIEEVIAATGRPLIDAPDHYRLNGLISIVDLISMLRLDEEGVKRLTQEARLVTDDRNLMATDSRPYADGLTTAEVSELFAAEDPLLNPQSWLRRRLSVADLELVAQELLTANQHYRAGRLSATMNSEVMSALHSQLVKRDFAEFDQIVDQILRDDPGNRNAVLLKLRHLMSIPGNVDQIAQLRGSVDDRTRVAVDAWIALQMGDPQKVAQVDSVLAEIPASDILYDLALELRAAWRTLAITDDVRIYQDAMRYINIAIAERPSFSRDQARATLAWKLRDGNALSESVFSSGYAAFQLAVAHNSGQRPLADSQVTHVLNSLQQFRDYMNSPEIRFENPDRALTVLTEIENLLQIYSRMRAASAS